MTYRQASVRPLLRCGLGHIHFGVYKDQELISLCIRLFNFPLFAADPFYSAPASTQLLLLLNVPLTVPLTILL